MLDRAISDTKYFAAKAIMLQSKLDEMIWAFNQNMRWLNLLDNRLEAISPGKRKEREYLWLSYQQDLTAERLTKNGNAAQIKLQMEIEMAKATTGVNKTIGKKLKSILS